MYSSRSIVWNDFPQKVDLYTGIYGNDDADNRLFCFDRQTGRPYHNFISWQDMRSHTYVESWNKSLTLKVNLTIYYAFFVISFISHESSINNLLSDVHEGHLSTCVEWPCNN